MSNELEEPMFSPLLRMRKAIFILAILALVSVPLHADLQPKQNDADSYDIVDSCQSIDQCGVTQAGGGSYGWHYSSCTGRMCLKCAMDPSRGSHEICVLLEEDGSCSCSWSDNGGCQTYGTCKHKA